MITLGMDPHPGSHTVAALDCNGSLLGSIKVQNTSAGLEQLHQFASQFVCRRWAIEGAGNRFVAQFVNELVAKGEAGEAVYAIAPSLTSQYRCRRGTKKNDQVDAANVGSGFAGQSAAPILTAFRQTAGVARAVTGLAEASRTAQIEPLCPRRTPRTLACKSCPRRSDPHADAPTQRIRETASKYRSHCHAEALGATWSWRDRGRYAARRSGRSAALSNCGSLCQLLRSSSCRKREWAKLPDAGESWWKSPPQLGLAHHCIGPITYGRRSFQAIHDKTNRSWKDKTRRLALDLQNHSSVVIVVRAPPRLDNHIPGSASAQQSSWRIKH